MLQSDKKILIFKLNKEKYATDIGEVERILGYQQPTLIPQAPDFVEGVINYEESVLPIISLSKKFHLPEYPEDENRKIIVVKKEEKKFGVIVENVYEVTDISGDDIENPPEITNLSNEDYIRGLIRVKDDIVIVLDLQKILSVEDEEKIF